MKKKISIYDIARHLNISTTTISFVLNGKGTERRISAAVQQKILDYVQSIDYKPNAVAQSLRTGKSRIIAMLIEDIADPFFAGISRIVEQKAAERGYKVLFCSTENNTEQTKSLLRLMQERQVEGYIIAPPPGIETELKRILADNTALVLFDRHFADLDTHYIEIDNERGTLQAVNHFIENGFRRIALVTLASSQTQMTGRSRGYELALQYFSLSPLILSIEYGCEESVISEQIKQFLNENSGIDSILFTTNYLTIAGIKAIRSLDLQIPNDIAVIGFDDNMHFPMFSPTITAVAQPMKAISETAINKLLDLLEGRESKSVCSHTILDVELIVRESSLRRISVSTT